MIVNYLYDLESLIDIDSKKTHIIYADNIVEVFGQSKESILNLIQANIKKPKSGEVYLITNHYFTQKLYFLYIESAGRAWVKLLQYVDMDLGIDQSYALTKADYDVFKSYPMFANDEDLAFFMAVQEYPTTSSLKLQYQPDSQIIPDAMNTMNIFLKEGLWVANLAFNPNLNINYEDLSKKPEDYIGGLGITNIQDNQKYFTGEFEGNKILIYKHPTEHYSFFVVGPYEAIKQLYVNNQEYGFTSVFGAGYFYFNESSFSAYPSDYKNEFGGPVPKSADEIKILESVAKNDPSAKQKVEEVIEASTSKTEEKPDFWADTEKLFTEAIKEDGIKKKKDRKKNFKIQAEVSAEEKKLANAQAAVVKETPKQVTLKTKKVPSLSDTIQLAQKEKQTLENPAITYPHDWDYVYSLTECSNFYNLTKGYRFSRNTNKWDTDETQTKGMTIREWNAFFISHPELAHLIDPILGQFGGIVNTEEDLRNGGELLFNPQTNKLQYAAEYLKGNAYTLLEQLQGVKDVVEQLYGIDFYNKQVGFIEAAMPRPKSIDDPNPESVPFIHPLDEVVVKFDLNTAANKTFPKSLNGKIMRTAYEAVKNDPNTTIDIESLGQELQSLSIIVFFKDWLTTQYGKLAGYDLPSIDIVSDVYFSGISYKSFSEDAIKYGYKFKFTPTESDFFEVKDNVKRFVNDLFQDFLKTQITQDDRDKISREWNKTYNGFIQMDIHKFPIFIRHSKYFKDRNKARLLQYTQDQIEGIKFATINNGSIMALEVGFGKTLVSIGYMSHCFETNQANNILTLVPKTLYVNKKWKEEIAGEYDAKRNKYIIGAIPQYNIIEMGNFTPQSIFEAGVENEERTYKNYSDQDVANIQRYDQYLVDIGAKKGTRATTAGLPTDAYKFRLPVIGSANSWTKIVDTLATNDKVLFNRCKGSAGEEMNSLLNLFANTDLGTSAKEKKEKLMLLVDELSKISFYYKYWIPKYGQLPMDLVANPQEAKQLIFFFNEETNDYAFERDAKGKLVYKPDSDGINRKVPLPGLKVGEQYVLTKLEEIHAWLAATLVKMYGYAIYEYGVWKFQSAQHNIILATRDSLAYLGFSNDSREDVQNVVREITTYKNEVEFDSARVDSITYVNEIGEKEVFKRKPEQVLQRQLEMLMSKISNLMTEEGSRGKFILSNLKIDGFVLDEAHIAKKVFTNVKTASSLSIVDQYGKMTKINTSSHDIKGVAASDLALRVFGVCQYIRSLGDKKPVMLLTATPFSNQPTEIFTMLAMVGIKQLREQGISNIKNFFDLFLKETLKYDFDHTGEFIKRISVEEFRNKNLLLNLIWSVIDIKREPNLDKAALLKKEKEDSDSEIRPMKIIFPKLVSDTSKEVIETEAEENGDIGLSECEQFGNINTVAIVNRMNINTSSIVDRNEVQKQMMSDIDKVLTNQPNPNNPVLDADKKPVLDPTTQKPLYHAYTFEDICPNAEIFTELDEREAKEIEAGTKKAKKEKDGKGAVKVSRFDEKGKVFKALGLSRSIALTPYLFPCNTLPEPTPENFIKYSPKIEYLVKALQAVKEHHTIVIPKKIKDLETIIEKTKAKGKLSNEDKLQLESDLRKLRHLKSSTDVSGQVAYFNVLRFKYYYKDSAGKAQFKEYNIADLIKEYLVKKGVFKADEVAIYSSDTGKENRENFIKDFQEGKIKVFLGTPSMREGVDLQHKASTLFVMTPDWNSTDMRQIEGRIWRRDNEHKFVRIVYVLLDQSIEMFIYSKLEEKSRRLQQIMKMRNTVEEIEEMSVDPNHIKVALASDPIMRADIITKLCENTLAEKRSKVAHSREELKKVSEKLDDIVEAIEVVRDNYLEPFYEAYPAILQRRADYQKKEIVEVFVNNKEKFLEMFAQRPATGRIADKHLLSNLDIIYYGESRERSLGVFRKMDLNAIMDVLTGYKVIIENKDVFLPLSKDPYQGYASRCDAYTGLNPMMYSTGALEKNQVVTNLFYASGTVNVGDNIRGDSGVKLFGGMRILFFPEDIQQMILKDVNKLVVRQGSISKDNVISALDTLADKIVRSLTAFIQNNPLVRPENYQPYVDASNVIATTVTMEEFDNKDLFGKIHIIKDMQTIIKGQAVSAYMSMTAENKKKILSGKWDQKPSLAELIPILNLQDITKGGTTELDRIIAPISDLSSVMDDVQENFLKTRNLKITDLPKLVQDFERDYKKINEKIDSLKVSREKLIKKFEKIQKERSEVSIDDIVAKFAETNNYLESKMSYGLKA